MFTKVKDGVGKALPFVKTIAPTVTTLLGVPQLNPFINKGLDLVQHGINYTNDLQKQKDAGASVADIARKAISDGITVAPQIHDLLRKMGV
jgi:hypothetical protein